MADAGAVRDQLIEATAVLLRSKTPDAISLSDIATAAGVSKALLLYHFGSRQVLMLAALDSLLARISSRLEALLEQLVVSSKSEPIVGVLSLFSYELSGPEQVSGVLLRLLAVGTVDDAVRQRLIRFQTRLVALFARALSSRPGSVGPEAMAELVYASALGLELSRLFADQPTRIEMAATLLRERMRRNDPTE